MINKFVRWIRPLFTTHADVKNKSKGAIYLSPLKDSPKKRELLPRFYKIKEESRLQVFVYLIQRL